MIIETIEKTLAPSWLDTQLASLYEAYGIAGQNQAILKDIVFTEKALRTIYKNYAENKSVEDAREALVRFLSLRWLYLKDTPISYHHAQNYQPNQLCLKLANNLFIDTEKAIAQVLMPDIGERLPKDGMSLKEATESEEHGFELTLFCLTSEGKYIDIHSFYSYAKINSDYVFGQFQQKEHSQDLFHLTEGEISEVASVAGEKSKEYIAELYNQHLLKHQQTHLYSQIQMLKSACFQASVKAGGEELKAYLPSCEKIIETFYHYWMSLSEEQRNSVKSLKVSYGNNYPLESYLLLLFSGCNSDSVTLTEEQLQRVRDEKILRCMQQIANTLDVFCHHYTEAFMTISPVIDDIDMEENPPKRTPTVLDNPEIVEEIIAAVEATHVDIKVKLDIDLTPVSRAEQIYDALLSNDYAQLFSHIATDSDLKNLVKLFSCLNTQIDEKLQQLFFEKTTAIIVPLTEFQQMMMVEELLSIATRNLEQTLLLIPPYLINDYINTQYSHHLVKELKETPQKQSQLLSALSNYDISFINVCHLKNLLEEVADDIWIEMVSGPLNRGISVFLKDNPHQLRHLIAEVPAIHRSQFIVNCTHSFSSLAHDDLSIIMGHLSDNDFEIFFGKEEVKQRVIELESAYLLASFFIFERISANRLSFLIRQGYFDNPLIIKKAIEIGDSDYLITLSGCFWELLKANELHPKSNEQALAIVELLQQSFPDELSDLADNLFSLIDMTNIQGLYKALNSTSSRHAQDFIIAQVKTSLEQADADETITMLISGLTNVTSLQLLIKLMIHTSLTLSREQERLLTEKVSELCSPYHFYEVMILVQNIVEDNLLDTKQLQRLLPRDLLDNYVKSTNCHSYLKKLSTAPKQQLQLITLLADNNISFYDIHNLLRFLELIADEIWEEAVTHPLKPILDDFLAHSSQLTLLIELLPERRRAGLIRAISINVSELPAYMIDRVVTYLNDDDIEHLLKKPGTLEHLTTLFDKYISYDCFILQTMSSRRFHFLINHGYFDNKNVIQRALKKNDTAYLNQLSDIYLEMISSGTLHVASNAHLLIIIKLLTQTQDTWQQEYDSYLCELFNIECAQHLVDVLANIPQASLQKKLVTQYCELYQQIPSADVIRHLKDDGLKQAALINLFAAQPIYVNGICHLYDYQILEDISENIEQLPLSLNTLLDYIPADKLLNFIELNPNLLTNLSKNIEAALTCCRRIDKSDKLTLIENICRQLTQQNNHESRHIKVVLANNLLHEELVHSAITVAFVTKLSTAQLESSEDFKGKTTLLAFLQSGQEQTALNLAKFLLMSYCGEYTYNLFSMFGHPQFSVIQSICARANSLSVLIDGIFSLCADTFTPELTDYMYSICELDNQSFEERFEQAFDTLGTQPATINVV